MLPLRSLGARATGLLAFMMSSAALAQPVLITASQTISPGQATITPTAGGAAVPLATAQITVSGASTVLTINGEHAIASLTLQNSASVTHTAGFTYDADPGPGVVLAGGFALTVAGDVRVNTGTAITVSAKGYGGGQGPGAGVYRPCCTGQAGGGGHGGSGGSEATAGGGTYGSFTQPTTLGSGGGGEGSNAGRAGGGAVKINVGGVLTVDGTIQADGVSGSLAGGAGGSIWLTATTLAGSGTIQANGGQRTNGTGDGGGGRVAVYADTSTYTGAMTARGIEGGGVGTVYLSIAGENTLIFDGASATSYQSDPFIVDGDVIVRNGARVGHPFADINGLEIAATGNVTIESGALIDVSGQGYGGGQGPGAGVYRPCCTGQAGGGGHGGSGGSEATAGGGTYGSFTQPTTLGSGGGGEGSNAGRAGGGAVKINVGGVLTVDGTIQADGVSGSLAGGAGGSIWLTATTLAGSGTIQANGGQRTNGTGDGGGGRVAVYSCFNNFAGILQAARGQGPSAQDGTVFIDAVGGNVSALASAFCTGETATLTVLAGGVGELTFHWRRNGVPISDGVQASGATYSGAQTFALTIDDITQDEAGHYDVEVTASCASIVSNAVTVDVVGASPFPCDNIDFNNDCSAFDPMDIDAFLSVYSEGPCIPETATCNDIDYNNDTSIFDPQDIDAYLSVYSEGPCL